MDFYRQAHSLLDFESLVFKRVFFAGKHIADI